MVLFLELYIRIEAEIIYHFTLKQAQESLTKERDEIIGKYQELKKKLTTVEGNNEALKGKLTGCEGQIGQLTKEAKDMMIVHDELRRKLEENGKVGHNGGKKTKKQNKKKNRTNSGESLFQRLFF